MDAGILSYKNKGDALSGCVGKSGERKMTEGDIVETSNLKTGFFEKTKNWFKNPYNLALVGILLAAIAIRLYYFFMTLHQPLWWDEAEYALRAKAFAFGTPITGWAPEREFIVPIFFSIFLKIGLGEIALRFIQLLVSLATVFMTYLLVSKISNKNVALYATFGMAFFWLHLFFTQRILLYLWAPLMYILIAYFFYTGFLHENKKHLILFAVLASIGVQMYISIAFLVFGLFIYAVLIEGSSILKNKKAWIALGIFILVLLPYMVYSQTTYGAPIPRLAKGYTAATQEQGAGLAGLTAYISIFFSRVGWVFTILSFLGICYFLFYFLIGIGIKEHIEKNKGWLLLFIGFFMPFSIYTVYGTIGGSGTFYDAFILPAFPFAFAFAGLCIDKLYNYVMKYGKALAIILVLAILIFHAYFGIINSDITIQNKLNSYDSVEFGGLWLKEYTNPGDIIISRSVPQNTYYSERETYSYPENESDFETMLKEKKPKYMVDSIWETTDQWIHEYPQKHNETIKPVQAYYLDKEKKQLSLIIYEITY